MPKKAKDAETAALAGAMLRELESLRQQGGEAYPPRLRRLAELTGGSPTDEQVQKAAAKKAFTEKAVVTEKVGRKPSLDAPVYFKEDAPAKKPAAKRAAAKAEGRRRRAGGEDAPRPGGPAAPGGRGLPADPAAAGRALRPERLRHPRPQGRRPQGDDRAAVVAAKAKGKPSLDAPVVLKEDIEGASRPSSRRCCGSRWRPSRATSKGKTTETTAFTPAEVEEAARPRACRSRSLAALERGIERQDLPEDVAWVLIKGKPYFFLVENLRPGRGAAVPPGGRRPAPSRAADGARPPARPAHDFAGAFRAAFERLDRRNGSTNFVKLADLRRALAEFGRDEFDAGLRSLRLDGEFSLDSHEGLHGSLTPEEREAGVREAGSLLVYASRR